MNKILTIISTCALLCAVRVYAQQPPASMVNNGTDSKIPRDPQALVALSAVIDALGGQAAIGQIQDVTVSGNYLNSDTGTAQESFSWKSKGLDFRRDNNGADGQDGLIIYQHNGTRLLSTGNTEQLNTRTSVTLFPFENPGGVLLEILNNPAISIQLLPDLGTVAGPLHLRTKRNDVKPGYSSVTQQDWYIDPASGLPVRVDFVLPDAREPDRDGIGSIAYDTWQVGAGVQFPLLMRYFRERSQEATVAVNSILVNQGLNAATFLLR